MITIAIVTENRPTYLINVPFSVFNIETIVYISIVLTLSGNNCNQTKIPQNNVNVDSYHTYLYIYD